MISVGNMIRQSTLGSEHSVLTSFHSPFITLITSTLRAQAASASTSCVHRHLPECE